MGKSKASQKAGARDKTGAELAALLKEHQDDIATAWAELLRGWPGSQYQGLPPEDVRSLTLWGLRAIVESLETGSRVLLEDYLAGVCPAGSETTPDAAAVTEALLLFKDAAVPFIQDAFGTNSIQCWALTSELDACVRWMVGRLTGLFAAEMVGQLRAQRAQVAMLLDIAQAASSTLELDEVVSRVSAGIVAALGVDGCAFVLLDEEHGSAVDIPQPSEWSSRSFRPIDSYTSAFHEILATGQPLTSYDAQSDPRFPPDGVRESGVRSVLGVPLKVKGRVIAVAHVHTLHDYRRFTEAEIALARGLGNVLGLVIQNAQLYGRSKWLTVVEERGRLAREIHDGIAQTLGALQLKASQLEESLSSERLADSQSYLSELQDMVSRAYRDLREAMFGLRAVVEPGTDLVTVLREYLAHYAAEYGLNVRLEASEDEPATLDGETKAQVMRILQEALRNVLRHAGTGKAIVRIERHGDSVRLYVVDEGQGFDPGLFEGLDDGRHLGLRTMRERAESVGGTLTVESQPGQGTRVVLALPLQGEWGGG
jgi:signal transduction histidine kinase